MSYNKNTNWDNEEEYLKNLIKNGTDGAANWAKNQLGDLNVAKTKYGGYVVPAVDSPTSSPYNENTNFDNETAYLTELSKAGNAGEQAWANNQLSVIKDVMSQYVAAPIVTPTTGTYAPTGTYNDADLPANAKAQIEILKQAYADAISKGDTAAAEQAHTNAEAIRALYGYSGGADGSEKIELGTNGILSWNDAYNTVNPTPTYEEPTVYGNTYSAETERLLSEILNREDFSYNVETDPLYAQYKTMYNREGDRAMRDTLAEAAASAGGMNSYAITAAQQANNYYASQLNDKIPELFQLAYEMYLQDKESKVQDLGILSQLDETQYSRYRDTMDDYWTDKSFAYGAYTDAITQGNWEKDFDSKNQSSEQSAAKEDVWKLISIGVTPSADLIAKAGMSQTDVDLAVAAVKAGSTGDEGDTDNNGYKDNNDNKNSTGDESDTDNNTTTSGVTAEIEEKCAEFKSNDALNDYLTRKYQTGEISELEMGELYLKYEIPSLSNRDWSAGKDGGINWFWGIDNNASVIDQYDNEYTLDKLVDALVAEGMEKKDAKEYVKNLQGRLGL